MAKNHNRKKINLALQGGGAHGAFTWGVLDRLLEDDRLDIVGISGTSAGAMNAVVLVDGLETAGPDGAREALKDFWMDLGKLSLTSPIQRTPLDRFVGDWSLDWSPGRIWFDWFTQTFSPYEFNPLNINPLRDLLMRHVDFDKVRNCTEILLFLCATNVRTGKTKVFQDGEITADAVMASSCLPEIYQAVEIDGEAYWDGGFMGNPPLFPLFYETDVEDVLLVQINPVEVAELPRTRRGIANRMNEITFNATLLRELRTVNFVKRLIEDGKLDGEGYTNVKMHRVDATIATEFLSSSSKLNLEPEFLLHMHDTGKRMADQFLNDHYDDIGKKGTLDLEKMFA